MASPSKPSDPPEHELLGLLPGSDLSLPRATGRRTVHDPGHVGALAQRSFAPAVGSLRRSLPRAVPIRRHANPEGTVRPPALWWAVEPAASDDRSIFAPPDRTATRRDAARSILTGERRAWQPPARSAGAPATAAPPEAPAGAAAARGGDARAHRIRRAQPASRGGDDDGRGRARPSGAIASRPGAATALGVETAPAGPAPVEPARPPGAERAFEASRAGETEPDPPRRVGREPLRAARAPDRGDAPDAVPAAVARDLAGTTIADAAPAPTTPAAPTANPPTAVAARSDAPSGTGARGLVPAPATAAGSSGAALRRSLDRAGGSTWLPIASTRPIAWANALTALGPARGTTPSDGERGPGTSVGAHRRGLHTAIRRAPTALAPAVPTFVAAPASPTASGGAPAASRAPGTRAPARSAPGSGPPPAGMPPGPASATAQDPAAPASRAGEPRDGARANPRRPGGAAERAASSTLDAGWSGRGSLRPTRWWSDRPIAPPADTIRSEQPAPPSSAPGPAERGGRGASAPLPAGPGGQHAASLPVRTATSALLDAGGPTITTPGPAGAPPGVIARPGSGVASRAPLAPGQLALDVASPAPATPLPNPVPARAALPAFASHAAPVARTGDVRTPAPEAPTAIPLAPSPTAPAPGAGASTGGPAPHRRALDPTTGASTASIAPPDGIGSGGRSAPATAIAPASAPGASAAARPGDLGPTIPMVPPPTTQRSRSALGRRRARPAEVARTVALPLATPPRDSRSPQPRSAPAVASSSPLPRSSAVASTTPPGAGMLGTSTVGRASALGSSAALGGTSERGASKVPSAAAASSTRSTSSHAATPGTGPGAPAPLVATDAVGRGTSTTSGMIRRGPSSAPAAPSRPPVRPGDAARGRVTAIAAVPTALPTVARPASPGPAPVDTSGATTSSGTVASSTAGEATRPPGSVAPARTPGVRPSAAELSPGGPERIGSLVSPGDTNAPIGANVVPGTSAGGSARTGMVLATPGGSRTGVGGSATIRRSLAGDPAPPARPAGHPGALSRALGPITAAGGEEHLRSQGQRPVSADGARPGSAPRPTPQQPSDTSSTRSSAAGAQAWSATVGPTEPPVRPAPGAPGAPPGGAPSRLPAPTASSAPAVPPGPPRHLAPAASIRAAAPTSTSTSAGPPHGAASASPPAVRTTGGPTNPPARGTTRTARAGPPPPVREADFARIPARPGGVIRRSPVPTSAAAPPAPGGPADRPGDGVGTPTDPDWQTLVDRVLEALEDRVLRELDRRGGRFLGEF
jgi:hypothetical protein